MTPHQVYAVAVIGGLSAVLGPRLFIGVALGLHAGFTRLAHFVDSRREQRRTLATCRAIERLGTTTHPQE